MSVKKISQLDSVNSEELLNAKKVLIELAVPKNAGYKTVYGYLSEIVNGITKNITNNGLNRNITIGGEEYDEGFLTVQDCDVVFNPDLEQAKNHKFNLSFGEIIFSANGNNPGTIAIIADKQISINGNPVIINNNLYNQIHIIAYRYCDRVHGFTVRFVAHNGFTGRFVNCFYSNYLTLY